MNPSQPVKHAPRACPLCGEPSARDLLWVKDQMTVVRCQKCSMVFSLEVSNDFQSGAFYDEIGNSFYLSPDKLKGDYSPVRYSREIKIFRRFCASGKALDIGCSSGGFFYFLNQTYPGDYRLLGNDVSRPALNYATEKGIETIAGDLLTLDLPLESFDAVCLWAVLEHLPEPGQFIARAADLLKPGGHCFMLVPNFRSLAQRLLGPKYRYILPQHLNYFTLDHLCQLIEPRFEITHKTTTHFNPVIILQDFLAKKTVSDEQRAGLLVQTNQLKQHPLLAPVRALYSTAERILGWFSLADNCLVIAKKRT